MANKKITQLTAADVADLGATTTMLECSVSVLTVPATRKVGLGKIATWLATVGLLASTLGVAGVAVAQGTLTDPAAGLTHSVTWNDAADTFFAQTLDVTNTASAAASRLVRYRVGGVEKFAVLPDGSVVMAAGLSGVTTVTMAGALSGVTTFGASGVVTLSNTTDSGSVGTGAAILSGGLSVAKALWVGGLANIAGTVATGGRITTTAASGAAEILMLASTAANYAGLICNTNGNGAYFAKEGTTPNFGGAAEDVVIFNLGLGLRVSRSATPLVTVPGTLTVTGATTLHSTLGFDTNSAPSAGMIGKSASAGLLLVSITGSGLDFAINNAANNFTVASIPTGTNHWQVNENLIVTGTTTLTGNVGIGANSSNATAALNIRSDSLTGTSQAGLQSIAIFSSAATVGGYATYARIYTAVAAFTMAEGFGSYIDNPVVGAGSTITTNYGLYIANQTAGGTNYAIKCNGGQVALALPTSAAGLAAGSLWANAGVVTVA